MKNLARVRRYFTSRLEGLGMKNQDDVEKRRVYSGIGKWHMSRKGNGVGLSQ